MIFSYSTDLDGSEYLFVFYVQRIIEHKSIYNNPTEFPYLACIFAPIYIYIVKEIISIFSVENEQNIHFILVVGRSLSLVLFTIHLILFTSYAKRRFKIATHILLLFIAIYLLLITGHMYVMRPDSLKFLLFTIAFILLIEYEFFNSKLIYLIGFLVISILTVFTKQDSIIYISISVGILFLYTQKKRYLILLLLFIVLTCLVFVFMTKLFGYHFYTNTFLFNFQKVDNLFTSFNLVATIFSFLRIIPLFIIAKFLLKNQKNKQHKKTINVYLLILSSVLFLIVHLLMLRAGSYINYAFETIFLLIFLLITFVQNLKHDFVLNRNKKLLVLLYVCALFVTNYGIHSYSTIYKDEIKIKKEYFNNLKNIKLIQAKVKDEIVFFPNIRNAFLYKDCNLIYGYDYNVGNFLTLYLPLSMHIYFPMKMKSELIFFSSEMYDNYFKSGKVRYIINDSDRHYFIQEYYPNYTRSDSVGNLLIYTFK